MKKNLFTTKSRCSLHGLIAESLFFNPLLNAHATDFIEMIRMTADHPSVKSALSNSTGCYV